METRETIAHPVRRILFATDFSEPARAAGVVAHDYAVRFGARVDVLHVERTGGAESRELAESVAALGTDVAARPVSRAGSPAAEIVRYATDNDVDLIVMGEHGRSGPTASLLGSVTEHVSRVAPCPVLVVPPGEPPLAPQVAGHCIVCGAPSDDLVCEPCRARIRLGDGVEAWAARPAGAAGALDREGIEQVLRTELVGRLGCWDGVRPYVVPIAFAYVDGGLVIRSGPGMKVEAMRAHPSVCFQVDHIVHLASWKSVEVFGTYRELHGEEASVALGKLLDRLLGWASHEGRPSSPLARIDATFGHRAVAAGRDSVVGRIEIVEMTGRYQQT